MFDWLMKRISNENLTEIAKWVSVPLIGLVFSGVLILQQLTHPQDIEKIEQTLTFIINGVSPFPGDSFQDRSFSYKLSETHLAQSYTSVAKIQLLKDYYSNFFLTTGWNLSQRCSKFLEERYSCNTFQKDNFEASIDFRGQEDFATKGYLITIIYFHR